MGLDKLVRTGLTAGLLGLTAMGAGACASSLSKFSEGEGLTLIGALMGESDGVSARKLAPYVSLLGQMRYQKEVVRGGRTQVNINQQEQAQNNQDNIVYSGNRGVPAQGYVWTNPENQDDFGTKKIFGSGFAFRWVDYNQNGFPDIENEFVGRQSRFREKESFMLVLLHWSETPIHQNLRVYGPRGNLAIEAYADPSQNKTGTRWHDSEGNLLSDTFVSDSTADYEGGLFLGMSKEHISWLLENRGEGQYSVVWRKGGRIMDSITFDLLY